MSAQTSINMDLVREWINSKSSPDAIVKELHEKGIDNAVVDDYLGAYRQMRNSSRSTKAFVLLGAGAFLGFVSCLLTILNPIPGLYNVILFGLTSVAITLICVGLYWLFEG